MGVRVVKGDLGELRDRIKMLASGGLKTEASQLLAADSMKLVADEFLQSRDPYGKPWEPLTSRKGKPLLKTGRMRGSVTSQQAPNGFTIRVTASYSVFHQDGTSGRVTRKPRAIPVNRRGRFLSRIEAAKRKGRAVGVRFVAAHTVINGIPRRQMLPERSTGGLGPIWLKTYRKTVDDLIRRRLRSAA